MVRAVVHGHRGDLVTFQHSPGHRVVLQREHLGVEGVAVGQQPPQCCSARVVTEGQRGEIGPDQGGDIVEPTAECDQVRGVGEGGQYLLAAPAFAGPATVGTQYPAERGTASLERLLARFLETQGGTADQEALSLSHVQVGEGGQVPRGLHPLAANQRTGSSGVPDHRVDHCGLGWFPVDAGDQGSVQLQDVRPDLHHPLESGVSLADVVHGDTGTAAAEPGEHVDQSSSVGHDLVLGDLELQAGQVVRQDGPKLGCGQHRRTHVHREDRTLGRLRPTSSARDTARASSAGPSPAWWAAANQACGAAPAGAGKRASAS